MAELDRLRKQYPALNFFRASEILQIFQNLRNSDDRDCFDSLLVGKISYLFCICFPRPTLNDLFIVVAVNPNVLFI